MSSNVEINSRPQPDQVLSDIADYVCDFDIQSLDAYDTARNCLMDTIGCGLLALDFPECTKLLGPIVEGTIVPNGARVPGTQFRLDPIKAAWDIGCAIRWLDFNDTWLAAEWGHPSDNLGAILAVADHLSQKNIAAGKSPLLMKDVLTAMIKAHEIQGVIALKNSFNRVGLCHVLLVRVASTAVITKMLGGSRQQIIDAVSQAWLDGSSLRTYRHSPNAGPRKSWAAGDATSRAVRLADLTMRGEIGYPSVLSAKTWGFYDVSFAGNSFVFDQKYGTYVMENILFKISFPAEFHSQTAAEAAVKLHPIVKNRLHEVERIVVHTHESAIRIISKSGPLNNPADRDHCLQYMIAVPLIFGDLVAENYEDEFHENNPLIDELRLKMEIHEHPTYTQEYLEPDKRSIANSLQVYFNDNTKSEVIEINYPVGHKKRRKEGIPMLEQKFKSNLRTRFPTSRCDEIFKLCASQEQLEATPVSDFMEMLMI
ncbi:MAG: bifunctional 2-methylcitrate dehydratase/aconitate hydratase [Gammaproteobacteria bacterium]|nr:bifunctional 2-methylcitrate dehydratase/aconitate hydratase [Gammaproteobacteria bacterium]MDG1951392.1 bifunctional 2-methylcitrate dehydratase/aconitate hydratase [Gammaproteobacteria bacterium]MDG2118303.1 bifunctional 2-methylcitrate dehydratase/aconitate hydratase [Gammaproteobacteria bacterium]